MKCFFFFFGGGGGGIAHPSLANALKEHGLSLTIWKGKHYGALWIEGKTNEAREKCKWRKERQWLKWKSCSWECLTLSVLASCWVAPALSDVQFPHVLPCRWLVSCTDQTKGKDEMISKIHYRDPQLLLGILIVIIYSSGSQPMSPVLIAVSAGSQISILLLRN